MPAEALCSGSPGVTRIICLWRIQQSTACTAQRLPLGFTTPSLKSGRESIACTANIARLGVDNKKTLTSLKDAFAVVHDLFAGETVTCKEGVFTAEDHSSWMPASAMTFFQIPVSRAMWEAASSAVPAGVSMPCWPYAACTSGALSALVRIALSVVTISGGVFGRYHDGIPVGRGVAGETLLGDGRNVGIERRAPGAGGGQRPDAALPPHALA